MYVQVSTTVPSHETLCITVFFCTRTGTKRYPNWSATEIAGTKKYPGGAARYQKITNLRHTYLPNKKVFEPETNKIKGKIKRERAKTPKFPACGGLKKHNNSLMQYLNAKSIIFLIIFVGLNRREAANFVCVCFLPVSKS